MARTVARAAGARLHPARRAGALAALLCAGALLGACGSPAAAPPTTHARASSTTTTTTTTSTTTTTTSTTTTSTTTTTLPRSVHIAGSRTGYVNTSFGAVRRVPVVPVPDGATQVPPAPTGSPQAAAAVLVGYRQIGSGPSLLLVMGQRGSMSWWDPQLIADLAQSFRVTWFDPPGIGYSAPAPGARSIESMSDLTAGLVAELGLVTPTVVGWGLGGDIALALAERHPALVSHLVLLDASAGAVGPQAAPAVRAALADPALTLTQLSRLFFPPAAGASRVAWLDRLAEVSPDNATAPGIRSSAALAAAFAKDATLTAGLGALQVPVLLIAGAEDVVVPPENSALLAARLKNARRIILPGAGYAGFAQDEPRVVAAVSVFAAS